MFDEALFDLMTDKARKVVFGFNEIKIVTCAMGIGPYGCGICRHFECNRFEEEYSHYD